MRRRCATAAAAAAARVATTESSAVASAEATTATCVTAAAPATVLSESWMRSESEHCGERQRGKELRGSTRRLEPIANISAGKCAAGKLAVDCAVFRTAGPVGHLTLLTHWVERRRSNCYCAILVHLTRHCTQWLQIWVFVVLAVLLTLRAKILPQLA